MIPIFLSEDSAKEIQTNAFNEISLLVDKVFLAQPKYRWRMIMVGRWDTLYTSHLHVSSNKFLLWQFSC